MNNIELKGIKGIVCLSEAGVLIENLDCTNILERFDWQTLSIKFKDVISSYGLSNEQAQIIYREVDGYNNEQDDE